MPDPSNIQHPTSDRPSSPSHIPHPTSDRPSPASNIQHPTSNRPTSPSNIQHPSSDRLSPTSDRPSSPSHIQHPASHSPSPPSHISEGELRSKRSSPGGRLTSVIIFTLQLLIKFRKAGLITLLAIFLINCYFMLFDQPAYIAFLEHFALDGHISTINSTFGRIIWPIIFSFSIWVYLSSESTLASLMKPSLPKPWTQQSWVYIMACIIWLLISYTPFLFLDPATIRMLAKEDSFYENGNFIWLLLTSICFFILFLKPKGKRNIFFLLLGLLFFFGAGEEISWGQRLFNITTPEILISNVQHELNIHNLPIFSGVHKNNNQDFLTWLTTANIQFINFMFIYAFFTPLLYKGAKPIHILLKRIHLPIPPVWISPFILINYYIHRVISGNVDTIMIWPTTEISETAYGFFFLMISLWMLQIYKDHSNP